ncbi:heat-inducible transcriptional repressor HrcA [Govanella unica]|uniref:Heat-inducible transcription repressor HrcA n=1 Tax=Govanella unica TaxID=2975056 RepID=A0A9X3Z7V7_9PROT|nr:heat-inducible transcriptional repressor HrcA [Govania unica]MDA5194655.1 heat-inducible transcriptional repressor HrcA [Govania unica]
MRLDELNARSRDIFRQIVETYLETGEPVGSRTLARMTGLTLSPASIRNVMADLEDAGLLFAPHTSAGRIPTHSGLRMFVDGLLEVGDLTDSERRNIEAQCRVAGRRPEDVLAEATGALSGLSHCAGVVMVPKTNAPLRHMEFVSLGPGRALAVIVGEDGSVENRLVDLPLGLPPSALVQASNYLSARVVGRSFEEARALIERELGDKQAELDLLTSQVVAAGLATWVGGEDAGAQESGLIIRGWGHLLDDVQAQSDLERVRKLFDDLETKRDLARLLDLARDAEGVRIFIGAENNLFSLSGSSVIIAPVSNGQEKIIGVIGVIGPTRLNYARIIPMVDFTAKMVGRYI